MKWFEIKDAIRADLLTRGLKEPRIRLSALDRLEQLLKELFPDFPNNPKVLIDVGKSAVSKKLGLLKETDTLNGAERSVLKQIFERLAEAPLHRVVTTNSCARHPLVATSQRPSAESGGRGGTNSKLGLRPIIGESSRVLILGTLPGEISLRRQQYYANPNNQFWKILSEVYGEAIGAGYSQRIEFLHSKGLALWDVLRTAERVGSADSAIKNPVANDFANLLTAHASLKVIVFNGSKAKKLFWRHVERSQAMVASTFLRKVDLPSTSPTQGKYVLPFEEKVARWKLLKSL